MDHIDVLRMIVGAIIMNLVRLLIDFIVMKIKKHL
nr:MAG TPA: hypothetical protein [Caudoviricetes sp.]